MDGHGFTIGWYDRATLVKTGEETQVVDGVPLLFAVTPDQAKHFEGRKSILTVAASVSRRTSHWRVAALGR